MEFDETKKKILKYGLIGVCIVALIAIILAASNARKANGGDLNGWNSEMQSTAEPSASASAGTDDEDPSTTEETETIGFTMTGGPSETVKVGDTGNATISLEIPEGQDWNADDWTVSSSDQSVVVATKRDGKLYWNARKSGTATIRVMLPDDTTKEFAVKVTGSTSSGTSSTTKPASTVTPTATATPTATPSATSNTVSSGSLNEEVACITTTPIDCATLGMTGTSGSCTYVPETIGFDCEKNGGTKTSDGGCVFTSAEIGHSELKGGE